MDEPGSRSKTIAEINERLRRGEAIVLTAHEIKEAARNGRTFTVDDVDVVTTGTRGPMSGTAAMFAFEAPGALTDRPARVWLNGVPGFPLPNGGDPTEALDLVVYGTAESRHAPRRYGGGHLFRDFVEGQPVVVDIESDGASPRRLRLTREAFSTARLYNARNAFRNYMAFANFKGTDRVPTIFGFRPLEPRSGITVIGSGEMSPLQNDPELRVIRVGTRVLVNGAPGLVVGHGTRSSAGRPNLSLVADMFAMDPQYMGGFITDAGPEVLTGVAVPIPILDDAVLAGVLGALDETVPLPVADIGDRVPFTDATYGEVWRGRDLTISYAPERCVTCSFGCPAEHYCPVGAIDWRQRRHDDSLCFSCGACTVNCLGGAFTADLGHLSINGEKVPIAFRQSDRRRAMRIAEALRDRMVGGQFLLAELGEPITHRGAGH